jgi:membrane-bound lytic murein transglycosylase B
MHRLVVIGNVLLAVVLTAYACQAQHTGGDDLLPASTVGQTHLSRAVRKARESGVDSTFLAGVLQAPGTAFDEKYVRINVTNYASKPDYSFNLTTQSVEKVRGFLVKHDSLLRRADSIYGVPKEVVASLLWVESKHGVVLGKNHVASVYLSTLLASDDEYVDKNTASVMSTQKIDSSKVDSVRGAIRKRAERKVKWSVEQLKALQEIQRRRTMNVHTLNGSWAGAFGMPQFIPSSYLSWAADGNNDGIIDLNDLDDAVVSVANYLRKNGWGPAESQQRAAVHHYNNSNAYVDCVLTLAAKVTEQPAAQPRQ